MPARRTKKRESFLFSIRGDKCRCEELCLDMRDGVAYTVRTKHKHRGPPSSPIVALSPPPSLPSLPLSLPLNEFLSYAIDDAALTLDHSQSTFVEHL